MSGTFEKLMKNRDYWRDEAKAGWSKIEALEAENHELRWAKDEAVEAELEKLHKEIHRLQKKDEERLAKYNQRFIDPDSLKSGLIGDVLHETARADELQELVTSLNYQNHKLHEKAKQHLEIITKEAFANEKQKQVIEFYQLKILNLLRREDGLQEYRTTQQALNDFFNGSGKLDGQDRPAPSLFGYPLIISEDVPSMPKTLAK